MHAREHTRAMLAGWQAAGVDHIDVAMRRSSGAMLWARGRHVSDVPVRWARWENVRGADIYIRPARGATWPMIFLDDIEPRRASAVAAKYPAIVVRTSVAGGCHLWLRTSRALDEIERRECQRYLAALIDADPASTSGEHLGRLAGYRNHKRGGEWVNVVAVTDIGAPWCPPPDLDGCPPADRRRLARHRTSGPRDTSPSGADWAFVCRARESGVAEPIVLEALVERCRARRGSDAQRYARRTVERAARAISRPSGAAW